MWKKIIFVFLIILFLFYVYFGFCVNLDRKLISKVEVINSNNKKGEVYHSLLGEDYIEEQNIGYLKIEKIGLSQKLYSVGSPENIVEKNVQILDSSDMPNIVGGNFILAAHSGFSSIAFFHDLNKLVIGDRINLIYDGNNYNYVIDDIYDVPKTGTVRIKRNKDQTTITLITCLGESKQLVVIGYLI